MTTKCKRSGSVEPLKTIEPLENLSPLYVEGFTELSPPNPGYGPRAIHRTSPVAGFHEEFRKIEVAYDWDRLSGPLAAFPVASAKSVWIQRDPPPKDLPSTQALELPEIRRTFIQMTEKVEVTRHFDGRQPPLDLNIIGKTFKTVELVIPKNGWVSNSGQGTLAGEVALVPTGESPSMPSADAVSYIGERVSLLPFDLAVDANRDGTIASGETASQAKPLRFWINNDSDTGEIDKEEEGSTPDHQDGSISSIRDLEDFQMLKVSIPADFFTQVIHGDAELGLKWKNISGTAPSVKVYRVSDEIDEIKDYIWNKSKATSQAGGKPYTDSIATVSGSSTVWLPPEAIKRYEGEDEHPYLLFEGAAKGTGQLCLVIKMSSGASETEGPGVWLKLMDVEEMFANAMGTPPKPYPNPPDYCPDEPSRPATGYRDIYWTGRGQYQKPPDETDEAIIHVHGWNMTDPDRRTFAESFFKRLWWKGYKGLFCSFSWPTYNEEDNTLGIPAHYNASEYVAWKYGPGLQAYVNSISKSSKHLAAHSMGNVVVASALLNGLNVNNYVAMEAAIPSGCYDDTTNNFALFASAEQLRPTPDDAVPALGYRKLMEGITGGFHNFHNTNDFALSTGNYGPIAANWENNQIAYKPNGTLGYTYLPNAVNSAKIRVIQQVTTGGYVSRDVADHHEAMAFVARPRSRALGPQSTTGFTNFDLSRLGKYPFGRDRTEHSGQYQRPIQKTHKFFNMLLQRINVGFNPLTDIQVGDAAQ